jgi:protein-disulfide isomerase
MKFTANSFAMSSSVMRQVMPLHVHVRLRVDPLPLPMHQPAATQQALWVECVGETFGQAGFWNAVSWVYAHTRSDGEGLPPGVAYPTQGSSKQQQAVRVCFDSQRPAALVSTQAQEARQAGVDATPTLRLIDHASDRSMMLTGPVIGDALLSALDLLSSPSPVPLELPSDVVSDMPR